MKYKKGDIVHPIHPEIHVNGCNDRALIIKSEDTYTLCWYNSYVTKDLNSNFEISDSYELLTDIFQDEI